MTAAAGLLRRLQARFPVGSLRARLVSGAAWSLLGSAASQVVAALTSIYVARLLGKDTFGELAMVRSTVQMFGVFAGLGLGLTVSKCIAECRHIAPERAGKILGLVNVLAWTSGILVALVVAALAHPLARETLKAEHLGWLLMVSVPTLFLGAVNGVQNGALAGLEAFGTVAVLALINSVLSSVAIATGAALGGLEGAVWGSVVAAVVAFATLQAAVAKRCSHAGIHPALRGCWSERAVILHFAIPSLLSGLMVTPATWAASALVARMPGGYGELGIFNAANQWRNLVLFVPASLAQVVLPILANLQALGNQRRYVLALWLNAAVNVSAGIAVAVPVALISPWLMDKYGPGFEEGWVVLTMLVVSAVLQAATNVIGQAIASLDRMWWGFGLNALWALELVGGAWVFRDHGAIGLGGAYLLAYALHTAAVSVFTVLVLRQHFQVRTDCGPAAVPPLASDAMDAPKYPQPRGR